MKKVILITAMAALMAGAANAERYVMITHTQGTDPFWPVVEKAASDAAEDLGVGFEYNFAPSGDMADMAQLIEAAAATGPDGLIVSIPDADALRGAVTDAVDSGIPVITINSGADVSAELGALMHIGQPEYDAGVAAGERAAAEGVTKAICLNQEAFNSGLVSRCEGYFDALGEELNMIDVSNDQAQIETRTAAALTADESIDGALAVGPHVCEAAARAIDSIGAEIHLSCFDLTPGVIDLIEAGEVQYTIDQQQYLQGYMPLVVLHLYNNYAGMLPGANIPSGPGFVDSTNAAEVGDQAGVNR
ncbi:substrate-binding domain-containing protein [Spiribacter sp. 221]|uniref:substrate-binding domain-containing protein n=1 Tax=Spiribacter onubensis TaxID=3122420 RepID=UPI00349F90DB